MKRMEGSGSKISYVVIKKFQLEPQKFLTARAKSFTTESVAKFL